CMQETGAFQGHELSRGETVAVWFTPRWRLRTGPPPLSARWRYTTATQQPGVSDPGRVQAAVACTAATTEGTLKFPLAQIIGGSSSRAWRAADQHALPGV